MTPQDYLTQYQYWVSQRSEWFTEWRDISDYIMPARGIYNHLTKPRKRPVRSKKAINSHATDALKVLAAGMQSGLTSMAQEWFELEFDDPELMKVDMLKNWLFGVQNALYTEFRKSNFYNATHSLYKEIIAFGTACNYIGSDTPIGGAAFRFVPLTVGEYVIDVDYKGDVDTVYRVLFQTPRQLEQRFGRDALSDSVKRQMKEQPANSSFVENYVPVMHVVHPLKTPTKTGKTFFSGHFEIHNPDQWLAQDGYFDFPYTVPRWEVIGSDVWGWGIGSESLTDVQRLQEHELSFGKAVHKSVDPPLNVPAHKKDKVRTWPGGINYYSNPNEVVSQLYAVKPDYPGAGAAIQRIESMISRKYHNDVFFMMSRDPNASPLKAREVAERHEEKLVMLGPVIERLHTEFLIPTITRSINILNMKGLLPQFPEEYADVAQRVKINFTSVLAQAQRLLAARPIAGFIQFIGGLAQIDPNVMDKVNVNNLVDEYAFNTGVPKNVVNGQDKVMAIREQRAEAEMQQQQMQQEIMMQQIQLEFEKMKAEIAKNYAQAGKLGAEAMNESAGMVGAPGMGLPNQ